MDTVLFPTHLLVGYVLGRRWDLPALPAVAGAALPDVLDKPLASAGVFDLYHTVGHSLVAFVASAVVVLGGRRVLARTGSPGERGGLGGRVGLAVGNGPLPRSGRLAGGSGVAFLLGWSSHLVLDAVHMVVNGRPADVRFLGWPFVHHVPAVQLPPVEFALHYLWTPSFFLEVAIWVAVGLALVNEHVVGAR